MSNQLTPEQRSSRIRMAVQGILLAGLALIVGPLFFTILHGLGAIAALITAAGVITTVWKFIPYLGMVVGNWRLKAIKSEAAKNPIETLQNQFNEKTKAIQAFKQQIEIFYGKYLTFQDTVKSYVAEGNEDAQTYVEQLAKMKRLFEIRKEKYRQSEAALEEFEKTIQQTDRRWKMALAAQDMNRAAGLISGDVFDKICIETAITSVQDRLNESFGELEMALIDDDRRQVLLAAPVDAEIVVKTNDYHNVKV
jgi:hypothetical protein